MRIFILSALGLCACVAQDPDLVTVEPHYGTLPPPSEVTMREGVVRPAPVTVTLAGKGYQLTVIKDGGMGYTGDDGPAFADRVLVGGAADKMEAAAVYLQFCHEIDVVDPIWADEYVPTLVGTGEFVFDYPDACPGQEVL